VIIPITEDVNELRFHYDRCDGLLIAGGTDVHPNRYVGSLEYSTKGFVYDDVRDGAEIAIIQWAYNERKPLTGICRGLQIMNVALGGSLYEDLESHGLGKHDFKGEDGDHDWFSLIEELQLTRNSNIADWTGEDPLPTNSCHHQGVKSLAPGLRVTATSDRDGMVEVLEACRKDHPCFIGVQGHPETLWNTAERRWQRYFHGFISMVKKESE